MISKHKDSRRMCLAKLKTAKPLRRSPLCDMNTPPLLIAAALLFWGWRTGWWTIAIALGVVFELSRLLKFRWEFTDKEYSRVFDVCTLLFGGAVIYLRFS